MRKKHSTGCLGIAGIFSDFFIVVVFVDIVFVVVVIIIVVVVVIVFDAIAVVVCNADIQHLQSKVLPPPPHNVRADRAVFLLMLPLAPFFSFSFLCVLVFLLLVFVSFC